MTDLTAATRRAYDAAASAWAAGPEHVYRHLAAALLAASPVDLRGQVLVDVGAGSGVLGDVARDLGARCIETDVAVEMLARRRDRPRRAVAADGRRLPLRAATCDVVTAGCSLSHVDDPVAVLAEARRVLGPGGTLLASAFPEGRTPHPVRACVEEALVAAGYRPPAWYERLKRVGEARVATAPALTGLARDAGFRAAGVRHVEVDTGIVSPALLVDYRLGMAQHATFVAGLDAATRRRVRAAAVTRLGDAPPALTFGLLVLTAHT